MAAAAKRSNTESQHQSRSTRTSTRQAAKAQTATPAKTPVKTEDGPASGRKRGRTTPRNKTVEAADNKADSTHLPTPSSDEAEPTATPARKKQRSSRNDSSAKASTKIKQEGDIQDDDPKPKSSSPSKKKSKGYYGLTPGQTPYPDWPHPTEDECREVDRILSRVHGKVNKPKSIPTPSLTVTGCGEVPSVLDALIRTRLSAATTNKNSSTAFQGLVKTFGTIKSGVGKGSVDWNKVRLADQKQVFEAIKSGGLANNKSKDIKAILDMVYQENQARGIELKKEYTTGGPVGADHEGQDEKNQEIARADEKVLSLDHLHLLSDQEATNKLVGYPGIGPKTASCVLLFCLRRDSFPVDTHVFRLCKWLGWVPPDDSLQKGEPRVSRETCHSHCEVRVPSDLKYALHQLLIKHGKTCPRCRAATGLSSERWSEGCPIESLVKRHGAKKGGADTGSSSPTKRTAKKGRKSDVFEDEDDDGDDDDEMSDLSDVGSEDE